MFKRIDGQTSKDVTFNFDGDEFHAKDGENLAAALLVAGVAQLRSNPVSGAKRAPFCMMGSCFECLVEINGITTQACMTSVYQDMQVNRLPSLSDPKVAEDE